MKPGYVARHSVFSIISQQASEATNELSKLAANEFIRHNSNIVPWKWYYQPSFLAPFCVKRVTLQDAFDAHIRDTTLLIQANRFLQEILQAATGTMEALKDSDSTPFM